MKFNFDANKMRSQALLSALSKMPGMSQGPNTDPGFYQPGLFDRPSPNRVPSQPSPGRRPQAGAPLRNLPGRVPTRGNFPTGGPSFEQRPQDQVFIQPYPMPYPSRNENVFIQPVGGQPQGVTPNLNYNPFENMPNMSDPNTQYFAPSSNAPSSNNGMNYQQPIRGIENLRDPMGPPPPNRPGTMGPPLRLSPSYPTPSNRAEVSAYDQYRAQQMMPQARPGRRM